MLLWTEGSNSESMEHLVTKYILTKANKLSMLDLQRVKRITDLDDTILIIDDFIRLDALKTVTLFYKLILMNKILSFEENIRWLDSTTPKTRWSCGFGFHG